MRGRVSTHSRPKAAGRPPELGRMVYQGFNTQPPEGGWLNSPFSVEFLSSFNTQPPEGGWQPRKSSAKPQSVSTHSRPKAAGTVLNQGLPVLQFQHTAARRRLGDWYNEWYNGYFVSTHSRPKAAGLVGLLGLAGIPVSTHSRPKAAGCLI